MDNTTNQPVICQYLSHLPFENLPMYLYDYRMKKLKTADCIRLFVASYLLEHASSRDIEKALRAEESLQEMLNVKSMSHSQLTRRLPTLPTEVLERLLIRVCGRIRQLTKAEQGLPKLGKLHIVDSTSLLIPAGLGQWAKVSKHQTMVKMHLRLVVDSPHVLVPEAIIPTTGNVNDGTVVMELVVAKDVLYVMDRGYVNYRHMDEWIRQEFQYIIRINDNHQENLLETYPVPPGTSIVRDAKIWLGSKFRSMKNPVRLVEYLDDQGHLYRVVTNRYDLTAEEVAAAYRKRWIIELFFKWLKQRAALVKLYSYKPQALWNTMYLCLLAYSLMILIKLLELSEQKEREVWRTLQHFAYKSWQAFQAELHRKPTRTSQGRKASKEEPEPESFYPTIGVYKPHTYH
jgi:transposase